MAERKEPLVTSERELFLHQSTHTDRNSWWITSRDDQPLYRTCGRCAEFARVFYRTLRREGGLPE